MSWSDRASGRSLARVLAACSAAGLLSGCFTPMYASVGGHLGDELKAVVVDPVPDRFGHYLHDALLTNLNGTGETVRAKYRLVMTVNETVQTALIESATGRPTSGTVLTIVNWKLLPFAGSNKIIAQGTATNSASYNRSEQRYANIAASHDAEIRDAKTLADQITTRVAASLASPRTAQGVGNVAATNALSASIPVPVEAEKNSNVAVPPQ